MQTQQRIPRLVLMLMGILVVGLAGACGYHYWTIVTVTHEITAQQQQMTGAKRLAAEQTKLISQQLELSQFIVQRRASWSWSDQLPLMVSQVTRLVEAHGVKVATLQPEPLVARQQLTRLPLRLSMHADLGQLTGILTDIRKASPVLAIDHLNIRTGQKPGDPLDIELTLSSFVMLENGTAKGGHR